MSLVILTLFSSVASVGPCVRGSDVVSRAAMHFLSIVMKLAHEHFFIFLLLVSDIACRSSLTIDNVCSCVAVFQKLKVLRTACRLEVLKQNHNTEVYTSYLP